MSVFLFPLVKSKKDESPREAAIRELAEETGFDMPSDFFFVNM